MARATIPHDRRFRGRVGARRTIEVPASEHVRKGDALQQLLRSPWGLPWGTSWQVRSIGPPKRSGTQTARVRLVDRRPRDEVVGKGR